MDSPLATRGPCSVTTEEEVGCCFPICSKNKKWTTESNIRGSLFSTFVTDDAKVNEDIDRLLASDLNSLSFQERETITDEMHGVVSELDEEETLVENCLNLLEEEIQKIKSNSRSAYDQAMSFDRDYVTDKAFRLMFLRAERFIPENAAKRMIVHFQHKLELFGEESLAREITFDDLTADDRCALFSGHYQFNQVKDIKGRTVIFIFPALQCTHWKNSLRSYWYLGMHALKDEMMQRRGAITVSIGLPNIYMAQLAPRLHMALDGIPAREVAVHALFLDKDLGPLVRTFMHACGKKFRVRFCMHLEDSHIKHLYTLQSFGIDPASVPLGVDGKPQTDTFLKILKQQLPKSERNDDKSYQTIPSAKNITSDDSFASPLKDDILLGRGRHCQMHAGNIAFQKMIDVDLRSYQQASTRFEKSCVVQRMVHRVKSEGGRFLKYNAEVKKWTLADETIVHDTTSARYRNRIRQLSERQTPSVEVEGTGHRPQSQEVVLFQQLRKLQQEQVRLAKLQRTLQRDVIVQQNSIEQPPRNRQNIHSEH